MAGLSQSARHRAIAAEQRRCGFDALAAAHERVADRIERVPYQLRTAYDLLSGDQVDVDVGFDVEPGEREPYGRGSPDILPSVVVVWVATLDGVPVDFDGLIPFQQRQLVGACKAELNARDR